MCRKYKAVMLAGGFGTRIQPLTHSIPKPMLPVVNLPMMEHTLNRLIEVGIDEVVILLYYKPEIIKNHFGDGSDRGIKIHYVLPDDDYGTAGAVGLAREYLDAPFIIVSGDLVTDFDFKKIFDYHESKNSKLTITLTSVENPLQFGVVIVNEEGKIEKFLEKPSWGEVFSDTINTGIYVIEPEILNYIPVKENFDFAKDLFPLLMKEGIDLMGYNAHGYWRDVGNPDSYREVHDDILNERLHFKIPGRKVEMTDGTLWLTGDSRIDKSIEIVGNVVIGDNVAIGKGTRLVNTVIGDNVTIGEWSHIRNSVLWHDIKIGKKFVLDNGVICNDNVIDDNVTAKAGLILAEGCTVGKLVRFEQDVTIWPYKEIEPAAIVNRNVVWGNKYKNSIFQYGSVVGKSNVELSCEMATKLAEAYAAQLPQGTTVMVGRDHDKSSRMIKRAFLGGLLSAGINVIDLKSVPPAVTRFAISRHPAIVGGAYVRRNIYDPTSTEINFFNEEGLRIDNNTAKSIEKAFFNEKFRRVEFTKIGFIHESLDWRECYDYRQAVEQAVNQKILRSKKIRVAIDLMHGITGDVFPKILSDIGLDNITLNAHPETKSFSSLENLVEKSKTDLSRMVPTLGLDAGFAIFSGGQRLAIVCDKGNFFDKIEGLSIVLHLLNLEAASQGRKMKVFLPTWAPDIVKYENLEIERGVYSNFRAEKLREYDLIATIDGNFAFTDFTLHRDAMYATLKILELLIKHDVKLSELGAKIHPFYYRSEKVPCPQAKKGTMMRRFIELAKEKKHSTVDGVKIWENETDWVLMIPDSHGDFLNLYFQANDEEAGERLYRKYIDLIDRWMKE